MKKKIHRLFTRGRDLWGSFALLNIPAYGGNAAYFIVLSLVPLVMLLLNVISYTGIENGTLLTVVKGLLPETLYPMAERFLLSMAASSSSTLVSVSALAGLWAASRGVYSILVGLNRVYDVREDRGYLYTRLLSVVYTFLLLLVLVLTLALYVFYQGILAWLSRDTGLLSGLLLRLLSNRFLLLLLLQTGLFVAMYMFMPNRRNTLAQSLPGAVFSALGWQAFSLGVSVYARYFSRLSTVYGSITALAIAMLWLYTCITIIFYGGALNKYLGDIGFTLGKKRE